jgi:LuxR family maltose regulon positive regulatory protein
MATTSDTATRHGALQRRRIIERPRLLALLDGSTARVRTLVAPAGYGKSTLAEQWVAHDGRVVAWFKARRSSTDVAALALGLARASAAVVPECEARLREHLRALPAPAENVEVLAEILGEDLEQWPTNAWLVIDEYEEIADAEDAERFVEALVAASPIQLVVTSRQRPSWAKEKAILYGDVLEISRADLAMDDREAAEVLAQRSAPSTSGLLAIANGWPAVIGLASVTPAEIDQLDEVPGSLYRYFAQEVFEAFEDDVQAGLLSLAIAPVLDRGLATELLGAEHAEVVCMSALDAGVLVERGGQLELHPLARSFLEERGEQSGDERRIDMALRCLAHYRERRDWEAAFDVIARHGPRDHLQGLLLDALDELLETGRLSTVETWCEFARKSGVEAPEFALARAEVALRRGRFTEAQTSAEAAALGEPAITYRALMVAGCAAHLASLEEEALDFYRRAEACANTDAEGREAVSGQLVCLIDLERPEAAGILEHLRSTVVRSDPGEVVQLAGRRLVYQFRFGGLDLAEADRAHELLGGVRDPLNRASFECNYCCALGLVARYDEALAVAESAIELARRFRLEFALPYALCGAATAQAGRRQWTDAQAFVEEALQAARCARSAYAEHVSLAALIRILAQEGKHEAALAVAVPELSSSLPGARAEALASRALVLASVSRLREASTLVEEVRGLSSAIEPTVLVSAVDAIVALKSGEPNAHRQMAALAESAMRTGALDLLVSAYRSTPELLGLLLSGTAYRAELGSLVVRIGDGDLASALGHSLSDENPRLRLSRREREVLEHVQQGLTNAQIAQALFIAESTVKVHVHHIFDKLGIRSRAALVMQARLATVAQATSAITGGDAAGGPSLL